MRAKQPLSRPSGSPVACWDSYLFSSRHPNNRICTAFSRLWTLHLLRGGPRAVPWRDHVVPPATLATLARHAPPLTRHFVIKLPFTGGLTQDSGWAHLPTLPTAPTFPHLPPACPAKPAWPHNLATHLPPFPCLPPHYLLTTCPALTYHLPLPTLPVLLMHLPLLHLDCRFAFLCVPP